MTYLDSAELAGKWLVTVVDRHDDGWSWMEHPGTSTEVDSGVGWGTGGPALFFLEGYRTTGDVHWLEPVRESVRWMSGHLDYSIAQPAGCGLMTGVGGWVVFLDELASATGDDQARALAERVIAAVAESAERAARGVHWHDLTEILWGTAGIACLMLSHGPKYLGPRALEMAVDAGDWLLGQAEPGERGLKWGLGHGFDSQTSDPARRFPNFAHGAAGIGFFLARLGEVSGESRFVDGALAAKEWIMTTARTEDDTCAAFHHDPGGTELFTLGWCHGPPGLGWFFRQLEVTTGDPVWRDWVRRAARADRISGIPEQKEPGFWDNVARCCGSAGVAEFFLDLHRLEGRQDDLDFALVLVDDLLRRAISDESGMRWSNYEYRNHDPHLPPEPTYMQGASGIGSTLLRLHRHLRGDYWTVAWPHKPSWDPVGTFGEAAAS